MHNRLPHLGKGRFLHSPPLPAASDSLIAVVLEASGLEADDALQDYNDLAALLAGPSNEQTTMGRKTLANVVVNKNDSANTVSIDCDDVTWTAATGNATGKLLVCYVPATGSADSAIIPLTLHDFNVTPDGTDITVQINAAGLATATN